MRITREPELYTKFVFLAPMRDAAVRVHAQIAKMGCSNCAKGAKMRAASYIAAAFMQLVAVESGKQPNQLGELKVYMSKILNSSIDEVRMAWTKDGKSGEIKF